MDLRWMLFALFAVAVFANASSRAVNISNTWVLPEEGFPVFYRYFRDRISWYEADAVCQFHHANLVTVDSTSEYDAVRAYLKELDITNNVWIGLSKALGKSHFTWSNSRPLNNDKLWQEAIPVENNPLCAATDPAADFRWHALECGGPEVASFICELPVPAWASGSKGCMLTELPSLTVLYVPEQSAVELTSDCGLDGTKRISCKGNTDRDELMRQLSCSIPNYDFDDKITKAANTTHTMTEVTNPSPFPQIKTTKPWIWTSNTIDIGDYGAPTRHRRETENTLGPATSTRGTTDLTMREKAATTKPSVFVTKKQSSSDIKKVTGINLDSNRRLEKSVKRLRNLNEYEPITQEPSVQPEEQAEPVAVVTPTVDSSHNDQGSEDVGEYSGVINQGQLFGIIENGTMFDIIEISENGTEESNNEKKLSNTIRVVESTTQYAQTKIKPEYLNKIDSQLEKEHLTQRASTTHKTTELKTSLHAKNSNKQKTVNDLLTRDHHKSLTKEIEAFPIVSDNSIKLNRTYRKKLPLIEDLSTKEYNNTLLELEDNFIHQPEYINSKAYIIKEDNLDKHRIVEVKLHKEDNANLTWSKLIITTKVFNKLKETKDTKPKMEMSKQKLINVTKKEKLESFEDFSGGNFTKQTLIDPQIEVLNTNVTENEDSEVVATMISPAVDRLQQSDLKEQFLPRSLQDAKTSQVPHKDFQVQEASNFSIEISPSKEPLEAIPQQQIRPNRQRLLTKPQRRSFYPYFFSRVLG